MGELTNALQGKLNIRKSHVRDPGKKQLDLFSSLADRETTAPKIVFSKPDAPAAPPRPEPEWVLPASGPPPDVSAEVRAVLSDSGPARPVEEPGVGGEEKPPLRTGVYHRPQRSAAPLAPPAPPPPRAPAAPRIPLALRIRAWFAGVELDRRMVALVLVLCALVGLIGFWSACPRGETAQMEPAPEAAPEAAAAPLAPSRAAPAPLPVAATPAPAPAAPAPALAVSDWKIPGTTVLKIENGGQLVRFDDPVFVSADKISIEGMRALKAVAAKLVALKSGARVVVTGFTDDEPLTKTTDQFKSNADIAAARAQAAKAHLEQFARANKVLVFEARTGETAQAPFPNDSPQNRRLNRTATVQVFPAP